MRGRERKSESEAPKASGMFIQPRVQRKLKVGEANDKYEQEADQMASKVVNNSSDASVQKKGAEEEIQQKPLASEVTPFVQKMEGSEEEPVQKAQEEEPVQKAEEEESVQGKESSVAGTHASSSVENRINQSKGSGNKLDGKTKNEMESGFGSDFSNVNIHNDDRAAQLSQDLGAKAFTHGNDVYFNKGQYNPESSEGKHLLAHELTHTIQQKGMVQMKFEPEDAVDEMIGKKFTIDTAFERNSKKFVLNSILTITSWVNSSQTVKGTAKATDGLSYTVTVRKSSIRPIKNSTSGLDQYTEGADEQAKSTKAGAKKIREWKKKEEEYKKAHNTDGYQKELERLQGLQEKRDISMNQKLIQETMYNSFDSQIVKWTKHYNAKFPRKDKLDGNIVKSLLYEETKLGTRGIHLEKPPYSWTDGKKNPIRSRFNLGQSIDSWAPQQYIMIKEMDSGIYSKYGLGVLEKEKVWKGMTNTDFVNWEGGKFWRAVKEFNSKTVDGKSLMGKSNKELFLDYEFWIRTSIRWLFEKRKSVSSWKAAVKAYNGDGEKATKYANRVINRVTNKTN